MNGVLPHVVHVISTIDPRAGGTTTQLLTLVRAQVQLGLHVSVVSTFMQDFDDTTARQIQNAGVQLQLVGPCTEMSGWHPKISTVLRDVLATADLVHIHGLWEEIQHRAAVIARDVNRPYIFSLHGTLEPWAMQQSRLKKQIYMNVRMKKNLNCAAALHYTSAAERELTGDWGLTAAAVIQPYAIDLAAFEHLPARGHFRRAFKRLENEPYVLFLGRLHPRKGVELLLSAMAALPETLGHVKCVIAGPSAQEGYESVLYEKVIDLNMSDRVIFTGALPANLRAAAYADAAVFVLPNQAISFGTTAIEALACGTRVLVSPAVSVAKVIETAGVGSVVADDAQAWSVALADVLNASTPMTEQAAVQRDKHNRPQGPDQNNIVSAHPSEDDTDQHRIRRRNWAMESFDARACALSWATLYDQIIHGTLDTAAAEVAIT
jgi:glycosyltransferase involved in cell wall biosynthesis